MNHNARIFFTVVPLVALFTGCGGGGGNNGNNGNNGNSGGGGSAPLFKGCPALPASTQQSTSLGGIVDSAAITVLNSQNLPGLTVAVAKKGVILYAQAYGYADLPTCRRMAVSDPMQIGSVTKQFTATAVLKLQEAGLIDLDHTVLSYLPDYPFDPRITVRMLLNQTSGLQDYTTFHDLEKYVLTGGPESIGIQAIAAASLEFEPGSTFEYSNSNYFILGSIIEVVTSESYADYLHANIFPAAGLTHTSYLQPSDAASPYGSKLIDPYAGIIEDPSVNFSAGQIWSNVQDLAIWDDAWLSGRVISEASTQLMRTPNTVPSLQSTDRYGMGWFIRAPVAGHDYISHDGLTSAYTAFNGLLTDTGFSVTALTNYTTSLHDFGDQLMSSICTTASAGGC